MATKIYEVRKGVRRELSSREIKQRTMQQRGWTSEQYNKEYDKFRNRLRAYEKYQEARGVPVEKQSPAVVLYREAQAMRRAGRDYSPSQEMQRIKSFPTISSGKTLDKRLKNLQVFDEKFARSTNVQFAGLIRANAKAQEIVEKIKNPVMREKALKDLAEKLHIKQSEARNISRGQAIPFGQAVGSDTEIDLNINDYL